MSSKKGPPTSSSSRTIKSKNYSANAKVSGRITKKVLVFTFLVPILGIIFYYAGWDERPAKVIFISGLQWLSKVGLSEDVEESMIQMRNRAKLAFRDEKHKFPEGTIKDMNITLPDGFENPIRVYYPNNFHQKSEKYAIFLFFHSGGFCLGSHIAQDAFLYELAQEAYLVVISIHYRLAPEYKFPTNLNDAYQSVEWIFSHIEEFKGDKDKVFIGGESAGANLATVIAMKARDEQKFQFIGKFLASPLLDSNFERESYKKYGEGYFLTRDNMIHFFRCLTPKEEDWKKPEISPIRSSNLKNLPFTLMILSDFDPLKDEGLEYAKLLKENGNQIQVEVIPGTIHGHMIFLRDFFPKESADSFRFLLNWIEEILYY